MTSIRIRMGTTMLTAKAAAIEPIAKSFWLEMQMCVNECEVYGLLPTPACPFH